MRMGLDGFLGPLKHKTNNTDSYYIFIKDVSEKASIQKNTRLTLEGIIP